MTGNLSMGSQYINNLLTGGLGSDAVNKSYVDSRPDSTYNASYLTSTYNTTYDAKVGTGNATYVLTGGSRAFTGAQSMGSQRLTNVANVTTAGDAIPYMAWSAWTPTLTWNTQNPVTPTTRARYVQLGKIIYWTFDVSSTNSNATTGLGFTLPSVNNGNPTFPSGFERAGVAGATYYPTYSWNGGNTNTVVFLGFTAGTNGQAIWITQSGFYEVS
jgi:hypothetical protein